MQDRHEVSPVDPRLFIGPDTPRRDASANPSPTPGQQAIVLSAVIIGIMLLGIQLWLLTVALDLFLSGNDHDIWFLPLISGLIFLGGLLVLGMLRRQRRRSR